MTALAEFLEQLLDRGEVVYHAPPLPADGPEPEALARLRRAYEEQLLDLAGPRLEFREKTALAAAEFVRQACWFLVHRGEAAPEVERRLALPLPKSPADHLSADVVLRFMPHLQRRARAVKPDDPLAVRLAEVLRQWPLSGVLGDVADGPLTPPEFGGHPGLQLLYAERLARHEKPAWLPGGGRAREAVELAYHDLGREPPRRPDERTGQDRDDAA